MTKRFRFLQTGDIHIGKGRSSWGEEISLNRASRLFDCLYEEAKANKCHAVMIAGDVFDTKSVTNRERELLVEKLSRYAGHSDRGGILTVVIPGNHDLTSARQSNLDFLAKLSASEEMPNLRVASARSWEVFSLAPGLKVVAAPIDDSENRSEVESIAQGLNPADQYVFLGHGTIGGAIRNDSGWKPSAEEDAKRLSLHDAAKAAPNIIYWAYGDIHKRQPLPGLPEGAHGFYAGAPIQMDFGDTPNRGALVIALDRGDDGKWAFRGRRYVRIDKPENGFEELVTLESEDQIDSLPEKALIRLAKGLKISPALREHVVKSYRVVEDRSLVALTEDESEEDEGDEGADVISLDVFDPLLASLDVVEREVLRDFSSDSDLTVAAARRVVGSAVDRFRERVYVS